MDMGHQTGSQFRRSDRLVHHDVDSLAGVCPETPALNRHVKSHLENRIAKRATEFVEVRCVQGPIWYGDSPRGRLPSGQWIPDALFVSCLWRPSTTRIEESTFLMENVQQKESVNLRLISLDELESLAGLILWDRVKNIRFVRARSKPTADAWWQ
jgi:DNA/RNA endonuclease G (NUC1)